MWSKGRKRWQTLRSTLSIQLVHSQSEETSGAFPLMERTLPLAFWSWWLLGNLSFGPYGYYFVSYNDLCRLASAVVGQWSNTCASNVWAKNSNRTTVRTFSNFNLLRGRCMLLPFPSALTSLCAPVAIRWAIQHFRGLMYSCACSSFIACGPIVSDLKYTPQSVQEHLLACLQKGHCNHYVYEYI